MMTVAVLVSTVAAVIVSMMSFVALADAQNDLVALLAGIDAKVLDNGQQKECSQGEQCENVHFADFGKDLVVFGSFLAQKCPL